MLHRSRTCAFLFSVLLAMALFAAPAARAAAASHEQSQTLHQTRDPARIQQRLENQIRHELVTLPFYSIFDSLEYRVDGNRVTLSGQVVHATLRSDAERAVKRIEVVESVVNNIEILPPSTFDDRIRRAVYRAVYGDPVLRHYAVGSQDPIHIIVKNGHVTLLGKVNTEMEKNVAYLRANGVPGTFSVSDNLRVESSRRG